MIVTRRLTLQNYSDPHHIPVMVRWLNDPANTRYSEQRHIKHTEKSQIDYVYGPRIFKEIHFGNQFIGTITAEIDKPNSVANVGILIGKENWRQGFGTEAWKGFCDHLLTNGIRKIEAGAMAMNFGMVHIFRKTGMHHEGTRSGHFQLKNDLVDLTMWARFI